MKHLILILTLLVSLSNTVAAEPQLAHYDNKNQAVYTTNSGGGLLALPEAEQKETQAIVALIQSQQLDEASARNNKLIKKIDALRAENSKEKGRAIASYPSNEMTLLNLVYLGNKKQSGYLVTRDWLVPYYLRAYIFIEQGNPQSGMIALNEALEISPFDPQVLSERGHLYILAKDWKNAEKDFSTAFEMAKLAKCTDFQGRALRGLGYVAIERKQWDKAIEYYHQALKINPNDDKSISELKYIEQNRGK